MVEFFHYVVAVGPAGLIVALVHLIEKFGNFKNALA
jgi:hypothetical protein